MQMNCVLSPDDGCMDPTGLTYLSGERPMGVPCLECVPEESQTQLTVIGENQIYGNTVSLQVYYCNVNMGTAQMAILPKNQQAIFMREQHPMCCKVQRSSHVWSGANTLSRMARRQHCVMYRQAPPTNHVWPCANTVMYSQATPPDEV